MTNKELFLRYVGQTSAFPMALEIERAEGIYLYGPKGEKYIDLISGIAVSILGHNHPELVRAVQEQAERHMHVMVYGEFVQSPQAQLAKAISETLPEPLDNVFFVNSGSEAVEGAIKLAKRFTGRPDIISCKKAYHGSTHGALSLSSEDTFKQAFMPVVPGTRHITFGDENALDLVDTNVAAVIVETVQGEAGVRLADRNFFTKLREKCDHTGALLILDEIQCGFGRTGKFWAFEHYGIVPDIITTAKGMGGGMPLGAFISSRNVMSSLQKDPALGHISTFGGHPVSCAAALANLEYLQRTKIFEEAGEKANLFKERLKHKLIREVRHFGLMMAVQFDSFEQVSRIIEKSVQRGLITDWFLFCDNAIRIAPPLIITDEQIHKACDILLEVLDSL